jgi:hypothetical protein
VAVDRGVVLGKKKPIIRVSPPIADKNAA